jgi:hypothetical protein
VAVALVPGVLQVQTMELEELVVAVMVARLLKELLVHLTLVLAVVAETQGPELDKAVVVQEDIELEHYMLIQVLLLLLLVTVAQVATQDMVQ